MLKFIFNKEKREEKMSASGAGLSGPSRLCLLPFEEANKGEKFLDDRLRPIKKEEAAHPLQLIFTLSQSRDFLETNPSPPEQVAHYFTRIIPDPAERRITEIFWNYSSRVLRHSPGENPINCLLCCSANLLQVLFAERALFVADKAYTRAREQLEAMKREAPPSILFDEDELRLDYNAIPYPEVIGFILLRLSTKSKTKDGGYLYQPETSLLSKKLIEYLRAQEEPCYQEFADGCEYVLRYAEQLRVCKELTDKIAHATENLKSVCDHVKDDPDLKKMLSLAISMYSSYGNLPGLLSVSAISLIYSDRNLTAKLKVDTPEKKALVCRLYESSEPAAAKIYGVAWSCLSKYKLPRWVTLFRRLELRIRVKEFDQTLFPDNFLPDGDGFENFSTDRILRHYLTSDRSTSSIGTGKLRQRLKKFIDRKEKVRERGGSDPSEKAGEESRMRSSAPSSFGGEEDGRAVVGTPSPVPSESDGEEGAASGGGAAGGSGASRSRGSSSVSESDSGDGWTEVGYSLRSILEKASSRKAIKWGRVHQRVTDWFVNPERALAVPKYALISEEASQRIVDEHRFPLSVDHFVGTGFSKKTVRDDGTISYHLFGIWNGKATRFEYGISSDGMLYHRWCTHGRENLVEFYTSVPSVAQLPEEDVSQEVKSDDIATVERGIEYSYDSGMRVMTIQEGKDTVKLFRAFE